MSTTRDPVRPAYPTVDSTEVFSTRMFNVGVPLVLATLAFLLVVMYAALVVDMIATVWDRHFAERPAEQVTEAPAQALSPREIFILEQLRIDERRQQETNQP